jgi:ATP-dependent helicase HrpB
LPLANPHASGHAAPMFSDALPIDEALPALKAAMGNGSRAVLVAPPGAGKTTRVPLALMDEAWVRGRKLIMLEPRRLAARAAAGRMAAILGEEVGGTVGLRVRFGSKVSARTRVEIVTEGVFRRMILDDPELSGVAGVLFDEFHERSLDADLGLALALDAQGGLREDLRLLVMSATLDGARVAALMGGDTPVVESQGRAFPVETRHRPRDPLKRLEEEVGAAVLHALADESGSILVFLPGQAEIRRLESWLSERIRNPLVHLAPLYGAMDRAAQDAAIGPAKAGARKVVLATSIAETSLTIEGVRVVIDCGLARVPVHEPDVGVTRLETVKVSRAAADQRRGRAGRTEPGVCIRLWPEAATLSLEPFARPEILAADLAPLLLDCAAWGVSEPARLRFLDAPPAMALKEARALLVALGALDEAGRLTPHGRAMRALPVSPRLAAMILAARVEGAGRIAGGLAVILSEQGLGGDGLDIEERLARLRRERGPRAEEARRMATNLAGAGQADDADDPGRSAGFWLARAYPDRIARQRGADGHFVMANGRGGRIEAHERLAREEWIVVADLTGTAQNARILAAAALLPGEIEALAGERLAERDEIGFDTGARALRCRRVRRLGAILISARPLPMPTGAEASAEAAKVLARGLASLPPAHWPWSAASRQWRDRVAFLHEAERGTPDNPWPDVAEAALAATMEEWLAPHLAGLSSVASIGAERFFEALRGLIGWPLHKRLDDDAPTHLTAPTGSRLAVDYAAEAGPTVSVRVQELYGLAAHPALAHGRIPVVLELLSPAHRPIQVTRDLPGFWRGSWAGVRAEMRGRYPRHLWPEDPAGAQATTRAKPRGT